MAGPVVRLAAVGRKDPDAVAVTGWVRSDLPLAQGFCSSTCKETSPVGWLWKYSMRPADDAEQLASAAPFAAVEAIDDEHWARTEPVVVVPE